MAAPALFRAYFLLWRSCMRAVVVIAIVKILRGRNGMSPQSRCSKDRNRAPYRFQRSATAWNRARTAPAASSNSSWSPVTL